MMCRWLDFLEKRARKTRPQNLKNPWHKYLADQGFHFGEWCQPDIDNGEAMKKTMMSGAPEVATAYFYRSASMMAKIAERAEAAIDYKKNFYHYERAANQNVTDAVCHAACTTAIDLNAAAVIIVTKSGVSARNISKYRPSCNIIAGTTSDKAYRQLNMSWGVTPVHLEEQNEVFTLFDHAVAAGKKQGLLQPGDKVVIGAGVPLGISGNTNMLKVQVVE